MKKNLRKITSLVLILAMSFTISLPTFAAEVTTSNNSKFDSNNYVVFTKAEKELFQNKNTFV